MYKIIPHRVLGSVPAQHGGDPKNITLCRPKTWLKGAGLEEVSIPEVTFTLLSSQGKVSQVILA